MQKLNSLNYRTSKQIRERYSTHNEDGIIILILMLINNHGPLTKNNYYLMLIGSMETNGNKLQHSCKEGMLYGM